MEWTAADLPLVSKTADQFVTIITNGLADTRGVHLETAISAAGSVAGVSILRRAVSQDRIDLSTLIKTKPGTPVFIETVNVMGTEVTNFMMAFCKSMGVNPNSGWTMTTPEDHRPLKPMVELVREFEKPFNNMLNKEGLRQELRPLVAGLAAVKLIVKGSKVLNPDISKSIALTSIVAASKTVPYN